MKQKTSIEIDFDVYKTLIHHSNYIDEPANDVLKRLLNINGKSFPITNTPKITGGLTVKNVFLPNGMKLRKHLKGNLFEAFVRDGYIELNGMKFTSPSGAAVHAAKGSVNGWRFWEFFNEREGKWESLESLRES